MASKKDIVYVILVMYVACTAIAVFLEPFATDLPCDNDDEDDAGRGVGGVAADALRPALKFPNALFVYRPCRYAERYPLLMGLTRRECRFGRHMVVSALLGGIIGYERRSADRPAGIRTMSVVSLSACLFTINSTFVFMSGPMHWDPGERYCKKKGASCARTHSHIDEYNMSQLTATIVECAYTHLYIRYLRRCNYSSLVFASLPPSLRNNGYDGDEKCIKTPQRGYPRPYRPAWASSARD
jgi:hypothetical protein